LQTIAQSFPKLIEQLNIKVMFSKKKKLTVIIFQIFVQNYTKVVDFGRSHCCALDDFDKFRNYTKHKYLAITGGYLQSYRYFDAYVDDLSQLMQFSHDITQHADNLAKYAADIYFILQLYI
jgi:hypothetical protein